MNPVETTLDIDSFEDVLISTVVLKNPATGAPTPASIDVLGPEHPARKKLLLDRIRKNRNQFQRTGKVEVSDPEDDIADETEILVACTVGWTGLTQSGQPLAYSADAARALYTDPKRHWLRGQIKKSLDEVERFIASSSPT